MSAVTLLSLLNVLSFSRPSITQLFSDPVSPSCTPRPSVRLSARANVERGILGSWIDGASILVCECSIWPTYIQGVEDLCHSADALIWTLTENSWKCYFTDRHLAKLSQLHPSTIGAQSARFRRKCLRSRESRGIDRFCDYSCVYCIILSCAGRTQSNGKCKIHPTCQCDAYV